MRVLVVHNRYRSGQPSGETAVVEDESALLAAHGCVVERLEVHSDEIAAWPLQKKALLAPRVVWSRAGASLVARAVRRFRPDVVHFHNTFPLLSPNALRGATRHSTAVVVTLHNFRPFCAAATFLRNGAPCEKCLHERVPLSAIRHGCYRGSRLATMPVATMIAAHRALGTWINHADRLICPSEFTRSKYLEAGWPAHKLVVKHNTAMPRLPPREGPGADFVCISRLSAEKGIDLLLGAWRLAFPDGGARLTVVGAGADEPSLRRLASATPGVELIGTLPPDEAMSRLRAARALMIPSRCYEGCPRVLVESYALGVPVVASRLGALGQLVEDGETGLTAAPGDPGAFADALRRLHLDVTFAEELGRRARKLYEEEFSPEATTRALLAIYAGAARRGRTIGARSARRPVRSFSRSQP